MLFEKSKLYKNKLFNSLLIFTCLILILIGKLDKDNKVIYKTANSCILFLPSIDNSHLITIDGLSNSLENLHPIQEAFVKFS